MNLSIFHFLNSKAGLSPVLDAVVVFTAEYLGFALVAGLLFYEWLKYEQGRRKRARQLLLAVVIAGVVWGATTVLKELSGHPRPFMVLDSANQLIQKTGYGSFPSGHTAFIAALSAALWTNYRKLGLVFLGAAVLIGISRVIAGVHWPLDIMGGLAFGAAGGWLISRLMNIKKVLY
jgi:undecaprenyl-diphosphatase